ncbi:MAG: CBS domain-containing protein [Elusimicrobia bacterium]|nr:CBS domain-containing protein [Elusimicrobiota bacterium]
MTSTPERRLKDKKIGEIINPRLIQAAPIISIGRAVEIMRENNSAYIVVSEKKRVVGMFTESDISQKIFNKDVDWAQPIREFMSVDPVVLRQDDPVGRAVELMAENDCYHIPLVNEKQELVNVLSVRTLIRFLAEFYPAEVYNIPPNPHQIAPRAEGG